MKTLLAGLTFLIALAAAAAPPPDLTALTAAVEPAALHSTVETLVSFGTRHTLSDTISDTRGIGAARRWVAKRFGEISRGCGNCLKIETPTRTFTGKRSPKGVDLVDVLAIQPGQGDANRVVIVSAHLDSRVSDVMDATSDAPGANDDGSGVAVVLETARLLSGQQLAATIVYAVLSGEEQGLYGGQLLAEIAAGKGWQVEAVLNNDIVGNSLGSDGVRDNTVMRVMSEATRSRETSEQVQWRRLHAGELDSPSRNLSRYLGQLAEQQLVNFHVRQIYRSDRDGRGGDQLPMQAAGFPAVRLTEGHENYQQQHQDLRTENGVVYGDLLQAMDFAYLAQVARLNIVALASMAAAPAPPNGVTVEGAVTPDTRLRWQPVAGAKAYRVQWRDTTAPQWQHSRVVAAPLSETLLRNTVVDDYFFGVAAIGDDGFESPAVFPGEIGTFSVPPLTPLEQKP